MYTDQNPNGGLVDDGFSQTHCNNNPNFSMEDQSNCNNPQIPLSQQDHVAAAAAVATLEMELQQQLNLEMEQQCNYTTNPNADANGNDIHEEVLVNDSSSNWQEMANNFHEYPQNGHFTNSMNGGSSLADTPTPYPTTPDLLNMFPFPRCSPLAAANSSIAFSNPGGGGAAAAAAQKPPSFLASLGLLGELNPSGGDSGSAGVVYDPLLPLNLPPQPPLLRELFHSLPQYGGYCTSAATLGVGGPRSNNYNINNGAGSCSSSSLFGGVDDQHMNGSGGLYQNGENGGVFEFTAGEMECLGKNRDGIGKGTKHFATERHRRVLLNDKYQALRKLVPNPTKNDRASIVGDAIDYINELKRTVTELKVLLDKKRCARERLKRPKTEDESIEGNDPKCLGDHMENPYNVNGSPLRSSWLHRKSKNTEVDVRIIDDEVTVKLVQQKRINCLLFVSKVLDDFHLDLHHVAGGLIGDYYSFLFNSKICEGSIVYASAVANNLIEIVDKQYAAILPTNSY